MSDTIPSHASLQEKASRIITALVRAKHCRTLEEQTAMVEQLNTAIEDFKSIWVSMLLLSEAPRIVFDEMPEPIKPGIKRLLTYTGATLLSDEAKRAWLNIER